MQSLIFFNKEGDYLNFAWSEFNQNWTGDLIFHENSDDTFKTIGLYVLEKIPSTSLISDFRISGATVSLDKFQLFNEYGVNFYGSAYSTQSIIRWERPNRDPKLKSKWIHGADFDKKFPIGTQVKFIRISGSGTKFFDFDPTKNYNVHKVKPGAILLLGDDLNSSATVYTTVASEWVISGVNSIGIYDYQRGTPVVNNLSFWSEPDFTRKYFVDRKLTIVNSEKNNQSVSIKALSPDRKYKRFTLDPTAIVPDKDFILKVTLKTDVPTIFTGGISYTRAITFPGAELPQYIEVFTSASPTADKAILPNSLKPGVRFQIAPPPTGNDIFLTVSPIINYNDLAIPTQINSNLLVIYENKIYRAKSFYTHTATSSIFPSNIDFWELSNRLYVDEPIATDGRNLRSIQLSTNIFYYTQAYTQSLEYTFGSSIAKFSSELKDLNINYYYKNNLIYCDLMYPEDYASIEFYSENVLQANILPTQITDINESNVEVVETLTTELNKDISENFRYDIVFTDIDEFGIEITINGQIYYTDVEFLYDGINVNMEWTIDQTIKDWLTEWYIPLANIGIIATLEFTGKEYSTYLNTISLQTEYPNVPLEFSVRVGTTANYNIPHTNVVINKLSSSFSIILNDIEYSQATVMSNGVVDFDSTLSNWVETWYDKLEGFDIIVSNHRSMLLFSVKEQYQRFDLIVNTGVGSLPASPSFTIIRKMFGNLGCLISSNTIFLQRGSRLNFEGNNFATGQLIAINGSSRPYNNQEYNIEFLGSQSMNLSYQGPFWSTIDPFCDVAPFSTLALANGFAVNGCTPSVPKPASPGDFIKTAFADSFQFQFGSTNSFTMSYIPTKGFDIFVDLKYINSANRIFILSGTSSDRPNNGSLLIYNSITNAFIDEVTLPQSGLPKFMRYNPVNNYLYCITGSGSNPNVVNEFQKAYVVDPFNSTLDYTFTFSHFVADGRANESTGDMYFTSNSTTYSIWSSTNFVSKSTTESSISSFIFRKAEYNPQEKDIYITSTNMVFRFNHITRNIVGSYSVGSLQQEIFYGPWNSSIYVFGQADGVNGIVKINGGLTSSFADLTTVPTTPKYLSYDSLLEEVHVSYGGGVNNYRVFDLVGIQKSSVSLSDSGPLVFNPYDGDTYLASQGANRILIMDKFTRAAKANIIFDGRPNQIIFNPDRKNIFGVVRTPISVPDLTSKFFEVDVDVSVNLVTSSIGIADSVTEDKWGALSPSYNAPKGIWIKTREYVRRPRANFNNEPSVDLIVKWENDNVKDLFLYDFTGEQLSSTASVPYTGPKPFPLVTLNRKENTKPDRAGLSEYQQTIFENLTYNLDKVDSQTNSKIKPTPIEIFIGANSKDEGVVGSTLLIYKRENIDFTIISGNNNSSILQFYSEVDDVGRNVGYIILNSISFHNFRNDTTGAPLGLKVGQTIRLTITDATNLKNKYLSLNSGIEVEILEVSVKYLKVWCRSRLFFEEFTQIDNYPSDGKVTYLQTRFQVIDKIIGRFDVKAQTEIEDIRYKIELGNTGHLINPSDTYIYKTYDINEQGIDWTFLNKKRKEMLMVRHDIYPYIGAYKSIVNAINYFGYNDLELYEYYRNTDVTDPKFRKLFKVEIPDIFDNSIKGWNEKDFLKYTLPNPKFEETNLFNLTFRITDKEGTNILLYSLAEVLMKLQGLKYWLETKIIPITHRILDITGRADFMGPSSIVHKSYDATILNVRQDFTPVDFALSEAYQSPVNSGSPVYTCRIDFFIGPVATYSIVPSHFKFKIRTYKTHKEWNATQVYTLGEIVSYYGKFYTNVLSFNRLKNPRKYENVAAWSSSVSYELGQYANYDREIYRYISPTNSHAYFGTQTTVNPFLDIKNSPATASWFYMTEWRLTDMFPVQNLSEFRVVGTFSTIDELPPVLLGQPPKPQMVSYPYNFTLDSNLDPFVTIELISDNGYGQTYTFKKHYEIRGLKDLASPVRDPDVIGPFVPIVRLTNPIE